MENILNESYIIRLAWIIGGITVSYLLWAIVVAVFFTVLHIPMKYIPSAMHVGMATSYCAGFFLSMIDREATAVTPIFAVGAAMHIWWARSDWPDDDEGKKRRQSALEKLTILVAGKLGLSPS